MTELQGTFVGLSIAIAIAACVGIFYWLLVKQVEKANEADKIDDALDEMRGRLEQEPEPPKLVAPNPPKAQTTKAGPKRSPRKRAARGQKA